MTSFDSMEMAASEVLSRRKQEWGGTRPSRVNW